MEVGDGELSGAEGKRGAGDRADRRVSGSLERPFVAVWDGAVGRAVWFATFRYLSHFTSLDQSKRATKMLSACDKCGEPFSDREPACPNCHSRLPTGPPGIKAAPMPHQADQGAAPHGTGRGWQRRVMGFCVAVLVAIPLKGGLSFLRYPDPPLSAFLGEMLALLLIGLLGAWLAGASGRGRGS